MPSPAAATECVDPGSVNLFTKLPLLHIIYVLAPICSHPSGCGVCVGEEWESVMQVVWEGML